MLSNSTILGTIVQNRTMKQTRRATIIEMARAGSKPVVIEMALKYPRSIGYGVYKCWEEDGVAKRRPPHTSK